MSNVYCNRRLQTGDSVFARMAPSSLLRVGAVVLLLGLYHVLVQLLSSATSPPPCAYTHRGGGTPKVGAGSYVGDPAEAWSPDGSSTAQDAQQPLPSTLLTGAKWTPPPHSNLLANAPGSALLASADPSTTTLHFTFGSASMMDFLRNWRHFVIKAGLTPAIVGAADEDMLEACTAEGIGALSIVPELDVWTYARTKSATMTAVQRGETGSAYYRHSKSSFLELGMVKVAFLWELLSLGFDVLISDLDVVWLSSQWEPWMTYRVPSRPPLPEAALMAMADVLVSTDELDEAFDGHGRWERWPFGVGWGRRSDLNTGVVFFRSTNGSKALLQARRSSTGAHTRGMRLHPHLLPHLHPHLHVRLHVRQHPRVNVHLPPPPPSPGVAASDASQTHHPAHQRPVRLRRHGLLHNRAAASATIGPQPPPQ